MKRVGERCLHTQKSYTNQVEEEETVDSAVVLATVAFAFETASSGVSDPPFGETLLGVGKLVGSSCPLLLC